MVCGLSISQRKHTWDKWVYFWCLHDMKTEERGIISKKFNFLTEAILYPLFLLLLFWGVGRCFRGMAALHACKYTVMWAVPRSPWQTSIDSSLVRVGVSNELHWCKWLSVIRLFIMIYYGPPEVTQPAEFSQQPYGNLVIRNISRIK